MGLGSTGLWSAFLLAQARAGSGVRPDLLERGGLGLNN